MRTLSTLVILLVLIFTSTAQNSFTAEDILPEIGHKWAFSTASTVGNTFDQNLGESGDDGIYDFSAFANVNDVFVDEVISNITLDNTEVILEVVDPSSLSEIPDVFSMADFFLFLNEPEDSKWYHPFMNTNEGLVNLGEMTLDNNSVPVSWIYGEGAVYGPLWSIPYDLEIGETKSITYSEKVNLWPGYIDSLVRVDTYTYDGQGTYTSPKAEVFENVVRLIHESMETHYAWDGNAYTISGSEQRKALEYRLRGSLLPLCQIALLPDWTAQNTVVNTDFLEVEFYFPDFTLTSANNEIPSITNVDVFPNPANGNVEINWLGNDISQIQFSWIDDLGRKITEPSIRQIQSNEYLRIPTPDESGIYFLQLNNGKEILSKKVIVE